MRLYVAATGSSANTYVLSSNDGESLILDAGASIKTVLPHLPSARSMLGCLITHEHGDHMRDWKEYAKRTRVFASAGTKAAMPDDVWSTKRAVQVVSPLKQFWIGSHWAVVPFDVQHDAAEPMGYLIRYNPTGETVLYATDTYYLKYTFPGVDYWIMECNYCEDLVDAETDEVVRERLKRSHMSLRRLKDALAANDLSKAAKIVLVHLSDQRSDEMRMVREIEDATGVETIAAMAGQTIALERTPF